MRKGILGSVSALALASPAVAADLPVQPRYSEVPGYEYRSAPPAVVEVPAETYVVRRPVILSPPPVVVEEYPVYASPQVYVAPLYAYAGPGWRGGWGHRGHFHGRW
jgi:opacity protein-like surface antigen